jgi:hypothetical protein
MENNMVRQYTNKLLEMLEDGILDWEIVCRNCLAFMSEDDVAYILGLVDEEDEEL